MYGHGSPCPHALVDKLIQSSRLWNHKPLVQYVGLPKPYLSGTVLYADNNECATTVTVTLKDPSGEETTSRNCLAMGCLT